MVDVERAHFPSLASICQFPVTPHDLTVLDEHAVRKPLVGVWQVRIHHQDKVVVPIVVA